MLEACNDLKQAELKQKTFSPSLNLLNIIREKIQENKVSKQIKEQLKRIDLVKFIESEAGIVYNPDTILTKNGLEELVKCRIVSINENGKIIIKNFQNLSDTEKIERSAAIDRATWFGQVWNNIPQDLKNFAKQQYLKSIGADEIDVLTYRKNRYQASRDRGPELLHFEMIKDDGKLALSGPTKDALDLIYRNIGNIEANIEYARKYEGFKNFSSPIIKAYNKEYTLLYMFLN